MAGLRGRLGHLWREARKGAVVLQMRDGSSRAFTDMEAWSEMFLAQTDLFKGESYDSEVLRAVRAATPESRREFEEKYGPIEMEARSVASNEEGGWAEVFELLEDGTVKRTFHEGGSEEAERIRREARERGPAF